MITKVEKKSMWEKQKQKISVGWAQILGYWFVNFPFQKQENSSFSFLDPILPLAHLPN